MPSGAQIISLSESGHGLGHVTPTIFGSTVGYILAAAWLLVTDPPVRRIDGQTDGWPIATLSRAKNRKEANLSPLASHAFCNASQPI